MRYPAGTKKSVTRAAQSTPNPRAMAIALGFGVLCAALVTLFLVPAGYLIMEDLLKLTGLQKPEPDRLPRQSEPQPLS